MGVGALLPRYLWPPMDSTRVAHIVAVAVLLGFGVWDDRVGLGASTKSVGQLLAVLIVILAGHVSFGSLMLDERLPLLGLAWLRAHAAAFAGHYQPHQSLVRA